MRGHGHVIPNPDGSKARCGGPAICKTCAREAARLPKRPAVNLSLRCSCGGTLTGKVSAPVSDMFKIRDIFLSFHREGGCAVTDTSEDAS